MILDELGFKRLPGYSADDFFEIISKRYEKGTIIITTNKTFEQWGDFFTHNILASAILDHVAHYSTIIKINGLVIDLSACNAQAEQRISRREEVNFIFFVLQLWKKSGFYSGILLDFEVSFYAKTYTRKGGIWSRGYYISGIGLNKKEILAYVGVSL